MFSNTSPALREEHMALLIKMNHKKQNNLPKQPLGYNCFGLIGRVFFF